MTDEPVEPVGEEPDRAHRTARRSGPGRGRHEAAGRSGEGPHGGDASSEPGGEDEYDVYIPDTPGSLVDNEIEGEVIEEAPVGRGPPGHPRRPSTSRTCSASRRSTSTTRSASTATATSPATAGSGSVVESLLPVLDDIHTARQPGDLDGTPFAAIADKLESILGRFGVERVGAKGEEFDPTIHEALMHVEAELPEGATATTVVQVIQPGFKIGERVVRAARVSVADPQ